VHSPSAAPDSALAQALTVLARGDRLGEELVTAAFGQLMRGDAQPSQAAALLMGLRVQGETGVELAGAARALRAAMHRVELPVGMTAVDTAGTGGGAVGTFNLSTAAALVAAGAGVPVAKHGNRSFTSRCGSADVLEALGVDLTQSADRAAGILSRAGMVFLFAPAFHPAMRHVAPVRRELGVPTVMNLVGPLANPAGVRRQVVGVADRERVAVVADALRRLGASHALVVHGTAGLDEIAPSGPTVVSEVRDGEIRGWTIDPAAYRLAYADLASLRGGEPGANAERIVRLFERPERDPGGRAAVILNAGAAIYVAGAASLAEGMDRAATALHEGRAAAALTALRRESRVSTSE
jgi:anthranilate phosphoribosyltransferase